MNNEGAIRNGQSIEADIIRKTKQKHITIWVSHDYAQTITIT